MTPEELADRLANVDIPAALSPVMSRAGGNMARRAQQLAPRTEHTEPYRRSISFIKDGPLAVEAYAHHDGFGGQGPLSAIFEYGQGPNRPWPHFIPALDEEAENAPQWLVRAIQQALS